MAIGKYLHHSLTSVPWAIDPQMSVVFNKVLQDHEVGQLLKPDKVVSEYGDKINYEIYDGRAVIPMHGVIMKRSMGMEGVSGFRTLIDIENTVESVMESKDVDEVIFDFDSPGGTALGTLETSEYIMSFRGTKPMAAYTNSIMASAAYFMACACDKIIVDKTSYVGHIGSVMMHVSYQEKLKNDGVKVTFLQEGELKTAGNQFEDLDDKSRDYLQSMVTKSNEDFINFVALARGKEVSYVRENWAKGKIWDGLEAVKIGIADEIGSFRNIKNKNSYYLGGNMNFKNISLEELKTERPDLVQAIADDAVAPYKKQEKENEKIMAFATNLGLQNRGFELCQTKSSFEDACMTLSTEVATVNQGQVDELEGSASEPVGDEGEEIVVQSLDQMAQKIKEERGISLGEAYKIAKRENIEMYNKEFGG